MPWRWYSAPTIACENKPLRARCSASHPARSRADRGAPNSSPTMSPRPRTSTSISKRSDRAASAAPQLGPETIGVRHQPLVVHDAQRGQPRRRRQRVPAERRVVHQRPVHRGVHLVEDPPLGQHGADRHEAARQRLGHRDEVGRDAVVLVGEEPPGAAHAGLHLVGDEQRARLSQQRRRRPPGSRPAARAPSCPGSARSRRRPRRPAAPPPRVPPDHRRARPRRAGAARNRAGTRCRR